MKNKGNAKARYSKRLIFESLIELLKDRPLEMITVSEICERAMVSRKTFYRNYSTKVDVLSEEAVHFIELYIMKLTKLEDFYFQNIVNLVFEIADYYLLFIEILLHNHLLYLIFETLPSKIIDVYKVRQTHLIDQFGERTIENVLTFSFGGFEHYIKKWLNDKNRVTIDQMNRDFSEIIQVFHLSTQNQTRKV